MERVRAMLTRPIAAWMVGPLLAGALGVGGALGYVADDLLNPAGDCPDTWAACREFTAFWQAWELARERFVDSEAVDPEAMTTGAIEGMLAQLGDRGHTRFLTPEEAQRWSDSLQGNYEGVGLYVEEQDGRAVVVAPVEGSPAEAAGIRPGDEILAVDGAEAEGLEIEELRELMRGPAGSEVRLRLLPFGGAAPVELTLRRARINLPAVRWAMLPGEVALVRHSSFSRGSGDELERALGAAAGAGARAVILDLRGNGGGFVNEAVDAAGQFLPPGTTVLLEEDRQGRREIERTGGDAAPARELPLVVLVDRTTASSAEILAGALQDAGRARLVGEETFGAGTVLASYTLDGGARLLLATREWLTPAGRAIRGEGIAPDEAVALAAGVGPLAPERAAALAGEAILAGADAQLARAYALATGAAR